MSKWKENEYYTTVLKDVSLSLSLLAGMIVSVCLEDRDTCETEN